MTAKQKPSEIPGPKGPGNQPTNKASLIPDFLKAVSIFESLLKSRGYANSAKLACLLEHWCFNLEVGCRTFPNVKPRKCLNPLIYFSSENDIRFTSHSHAGAQSILARCKTAVWRIFSLVPLREGIFPGGNKDNRKRFLETVTYNKLKRVRVELDSGLREEYLARLGKELSTEAFHQLEGFLPDEFFYKQWSSAGFPARITGSFSCFFTLDYIKALYFRRPLHFSSIQHGGCYGEYKANWYEAVEIRFSDRFFHWGLGNLNTIQNRFEIRVPSGRKITDLVLVGTVKPNGFMELYFPGISQVYLESSVKRVEVLPRLAQLRGVKYLAHPKYTEPLGALVESSVSLSKMRRSDLEKSLFILDQPGHTFLYKAAYEGIPFILYYNRGWREKLTGNFNGLLDALEAGGLLYYWDNEGLFLDRVGRILETGAFPSGGFSIVRDFLEAKIPEARPS